MTATMPAPSPDSCAKPQTPQLPSNTDTGPDMASAMSTLELSTIEAAMGIEPPRATNPQDQDDEPTTNSDFLPAIPARPIVTIFSREDALASSLRAAQQSPHLPSYQLSYWTGHCVRGPKHDGIGGFSVVHQRFDNANGPDECAQDYHRIWWQSCFAARGLDHYTWHADMMAVGQALVTAVDRCECISGCVVTKSRHKCQTPIIEQQAAQIPWPMAKVINVFTDDKTVLASLETCWDSGTEPARRSPMRLVNHQIEALALLGVQVNFSWVPAHSGDFRNQWALERARGALKPMLISRNSKVYTKRFHRVQRWVRKDKSGLR